MKWPRSSHLPKPTYSRRCSISWVLKVTFTRKRLSYRKTKIVYLWFQNAVVVLVKLRSPGPILSPFCSPVTPTSVNSSSQWENPSSVKCSILEQMKWSILSSRAFLHWSKLSTVRCRNRPRLSIFPSGDSFSPLPGKAPTKRISLVPSV